MRNVTTLDCLFRWNTPYSPKFKTTSNLKLYLNVPVFLHICSLTLAAPHVTVMVPRVVVGAVKRIRNTTLPKWTEDHIMGNSTDVERRKGAETRAAHMVQKTRVVLRKAYYAGDSGRHRRGEGECRRRGAREDIMAT